jgi:hypothetical protein
LPPGIYRCMEKLQLAESVKIEKQGNVSLNALRKDTKA